MSKEEQLLSIYNRMMDEANRGDDNALDYLHGIEDALNILNIQVKGIN